MPTTTVSRKATGTAVGQPTTSTLMSPTGTGSSSTHENTRSLR